MSAQRSLLHCLLLGTLPALMMVSLVKAADDKTVQFLPTQRCRARLRISK